MTPASALISNDAPLIDAKLPLNVSAKPAKAYLLSPVSSDE